VQIVRLELAHDVEARQMVWPMEVVCRKSCRDESSASKSFHASGDVGVIVENTDWICTDDVFAAA
jgi:hypothetical protein